MKFLPNTEVVKNTWGYGHCDKHGTVEIQSACGGCIECAKEKINTERTQNENSQSNDKNSGWLWK